jgi:tight adherence protein B
MVTALAAITVFAAVWVGSAPPPANDRLICVLGPSARGGSVVGAAAARHQLTTLLGRMRRVFDHGRREMTARQAAVIEFCDGVAVELSAGRPADSALIHAAAVLPDLAPIAGAARAGGDVPRALERAARVPGCDGLRLLAGCWRVGVDRGGMLAAVIEGLADALRDEDAHREHIALQLAGPRATARLLAGLPLLGLAMAAALGAHPLRFLLATLPGVCCLGLGIGLDALGLWWTARLAATAEELR